MIAISTVNVRFVLLLLLSWSSISSADATLNLEDQLLHLTQNYVIQVSISFQFSIQNQLHFLPTNQMQFKEIVETKFETKFHQLEAKVSQQQVFKSFLISIQPRNLLFQTSTVRTKWSVNSKLKIGNWKKKSFG
jgi:hypothetical protein